MEADIFKGRLLIAEQNTYCNKHKTNRALDVYKLSQ